MRCMTTSSLVRRRTLPWLDHRGTDFTIGHGAATGRTGRRHVGCACAPWTSSLVRRYTLHGLEERSVQRRRRRTNTKIAEEFLKIFDFFAPLAVLPRLLR